METITISRINLMKELRKKHIPIRGTFELTDRCNLRCRHCFVRSDDQTVLTNPQLDFSQIKQIIDIFVEKGLLHLLLTGGEPLIRPDFLKIYDYAKKKGILVSVYTNATLLTEKIAKHFKKYPPYKLEITVYGSNKETYERVTRVKGSYERFIKGLNLLDKYQIPYVLKTAVMRSNIKDLDNIIKFAEKRGCFFDGTIKIRFSTELNLHIKRESRLNKLIKSERLTPDEVVALDERYSQRKNGLKKFCEKFYFAANNNLLFNCSAGIKTFHIDAYGNFHLCMLVREPSFPLIRKDMSLKEAIDYAWNEFVFEVRKMTVPDDFECNHCKLFNLCQNCPGWSYLEYGELGKKDEYLCEIAHKRAQMLRLKQTEDNFVKDAM